MLYVILLATGVVSMAASDMYSLNGDKKGKGLTWLKHAVADIVATVSTTAILVTVLLALLAYNVQPNKIKEHENERTAIVVELIKDGYTEENIAKVESFNEAANRSHRLARNFWIGVAFPDNYKGIQNIPVKN